MNAGYLPSRRVVIVHLAGVNVGKASIERNADDRGSRHSSPPTELFGELIGREDARCGFRGG